MTIRKILSFILLATTLGATAQSLDFGYNHPWTAKTFYNPGRHYDNSWPQLCQAQTGDVYTVSLPQATSDITEAQLQLKTPINLQADHTYQVRLILTVTKGRIPKATLLIGESEDDNLIAGTASVTIPTATNTAAVVIKGITGTDIYDTKLTFLFGNNEAGSEVQISDISLRDVSNANRDIWQGTVFYLQGYYAPDGTRINDPKVTGAKETLEWTKPDFDASSWENTLMPIGSNGFIPEVMTIWQGGDYNNYWIRREFNLDKVERTSGYTLKLCHDDSYKIYVNGHLLAQGEDWTTGKDFIEIQVPSRFLNEGKNVIATYQQQNFGGKFHDCAFTVTPGMYDDYDDIDPADALVANEVQVGNIDQFIDHSYNYGAWVELRNTTDKTVNLGGIHFSDDPDDLTKHMIPWTYGTIGPHEYAVFYFDHHSSQGTYGDTANKQIPFQLNEEGGTLYISDSYGEPFITLTYPEAVPRCSYARVSEDTDQWQFTGTPTPGASNADSEFAASRLDAPQVDTDSRLFDTPFTIHVDVPQGAALHYTLDGTTPMASSPASRNGNFTIDATTTLRLRLFQKGMLPSEVVTRSYIQRDRDYYLPVIAISTDPRNLYDDYIGVYCQGVNGVTGHGNNSVRNNLNMDWERPVNVELITADNRMVVNQEAEFSISGGWSRLYAPSSFKLKARNLYEGRKTFDQPFFTTKPFNKYKQILVRNGGNDNDSQAHGRIKDAIIQQTLSTSGIYVDCQELQPTHVFFNGEYIGMLNLRDPANKFYATANYGYDKDNLDAFEYANGYFQKAGDQQSFRQWVDLAAQAEDPAIYAQLRDLVDIDEFANYMAAITYIGSSDWICNSNNSKGFRSRDDGRFHMVLFDVDWGFSNASGLGTLMQSNANDLIRIFKNSVRNDSFRRQFVDAYCLMGGSVFTPERSKAVADSLAQLFEPALAMEGKQPWSSYNELVPNMTGGDQRRQRIRTLQQYMNLGEGMNVSLKANIPEAQILVNGQQVPLAKFDGTLFAPVTLEASAPAGYDFAGWKNISKTSTTLISKGDEWSYYDQGGLDDTNWRAVNFNSNDWPTGTAPIGYGKDGVATETAHNLPTYYFRKAVTLTKAPTEEDVVTLDWTADDGFIVYVNGVEATRHLMPEGEATYNTFATTYAPANPDTGTETLPANLFRRGKNVIAVEVHNNKISSTDILWEASIAIEQASATSVTEERILHLDEDNDCQLTAVFRPIKSQYLITAGATPVVVNEVSAANTIFANDYNKRNDWIELYNTTAEPVDIRGMYLSDDPQEPHKWQITDDVCTTLIPAHGHFVIWADRLDPVTQLHAPFKLGNDDGQCVLLTAADDTWSDRLDYSVHSGEESVGRYPDGGKRTYLMTRPTILKPNQLTTYAQWLSGVDRNFDPNDYNGIVQPLRPTDGQTGNRTVDRCYSPDGLLLDGPQPGLNIVRTTRPDGSVVTRKVVVR